MVVPRQVEIPFYRDVGVQRGRVFGSFAQVIGRTAIPFLGKNIVPAEKPVGDDLLDFAESENAGVVSSKKTFKIAAVCVGRQTLRKQLGNGSRKKTASRNTLTKSGKKTSRSRRGIFTNISHQSCRAIFGTNLLWQFLEILEGKFQ